MKKCSEYCGAACIDGHSCPNILLDENPDLYYDIYGTYKKQHKKKGKIKNG